MPVPLYQIDAFTDRPFSGNPAAVCPLEKWPDDSLLQAIALENNLSETAFLVPEGHGYRLRWFTPVTEVDLCGHATLASAYYLLCHRNDGGRSVSFETRSGTLTVERNGEVLTMNFPTLPPGPATDVPELNAALGVPPRTVCEIRAVHGARYYMAVYESEAEVKGLTPDTTALGNIPANVITTAPGDSVDFVSRFFAPASGIAEDPVTGSAHCTLTPYWAERLGKTRLVARQVSARGGDLVCELKDDRVALSGRCAFYMEGQIAVPL
jgi:PhzF family phenazine biosynthesis protein